MTPRSATSKFQRRMAQALLMALSFQFQAHAASIANVPLATQSSGTARANLMFIMDNSGSMDWSYLPDEANFGNLCFGYHGTNYLFYNPNTTYTPPPNADGSLMLPADFEKAQRDGYSTSINNWVDLRQLSNLNTPSTRVGTANNGNPINSRFYYATYKTNANPATPDCSSGYDWTKWDVVTDASGWTAAQKTNYANWYSYYRTRMLAMRAAVGRVMQSLDATRFRVGYSAINDYQYDNSSGFLRIGDFDAGTQKADFYSKLYAQAPNVAGTPLRPALEKIGKYYAGRQLNGSALPIGADPLQYSCQRNYALLTTDGYWNTGAQPALYTPTRLDGRTAIGNVDNVAGLLRPRLDDGRLVRQGNQWVWTTGGSGVGDTLADIAMYFYDTDLRDPAVLGTSCTGSIANQNVCSNNVGYESPPPNLAVEPVQHQRMVTYALGLGVAGRLRYQADYDTANNGDFYNIKGGNIAWPDPEIGNNALSPSVAARVDDLWHAAVNGRGRYYSARNANDVVTQLSGALDSITSTRGTSAAAATSSQVPVSGDNFIYVGEYTTVLWEGNLKAYTLDPVTANPSTTPLWEAKTTLKAQVAPTTDSRTIWFRNPSVATTRLSNFTYANLNAAGLGANFTNACQTGNFKLSQCAGLVAQDVLNGNTALQTAANDGVTMVNFLRGQTGKEDTTANTAANRVFRNRPNTPLGDVVNAAPVYVGKPPFRYADAGYMTYKTNNATRTPVVYVAANDGMLHAFNATTGVELWAYVPTAVMGNMWRLADGNYDTGHRYFVDASPVVGDVYDGSNWRTILVGGLGAGGRAYYVLDITNPANPKSLWEFSNADDPDLGFTFGNPVITKNKDGKWVVAFSSGYNNHTGGGSGNGYLFIRDAVTGAVITDGTNTPIPGASKIGTFTSGVTPAGDTTTPSELGKINAWVDSSTDNTAKRIYGGDMLGYMWRFDFDDNIGPSGREAQLIGRALTSGGLVQPITTRPMLVKIGGNASRPGIAFGTGRYLGTSDLADTTTQSLYVVRETLDTTSLGTLRSNAAMVGQTMDAARVLTTQPVDWSTQRGWYVDFNGTPLGERVNVDMVLSNNLLGVATNQPEPTACNPGGNSVLYFFDITTGDYATTSGSAKFAPQRQTTLTVGLQLVVAGGTQKSDGTFTGGSPKVIQTLSDGRLLPTAVPPSAATGSTTRRTSWRELIN